MIWHPKTARNSTSIQRNYKIRSTDRPNLLHNYIRAFTSLAFSWVHQIDREQALIKRHAASCCCKMDTCIAWCAQLLPEWSSHTYHGTNSRRHHSRSRTHLMRSSHHMLRKVFLHAHLRLPRPDLHPPPLAELTSNFWSEVLVLADL